MSYNAAFTDVKPSNQVFSDPKPVNSSFNDVKPSNVSLSTDTERQYAMTLGRGMWLGFSAITYPQAINIISSKSP